MYVIDSFEIVKLVIYVVCFNVFFMSYKKLKLFVVYGVGIY